MITHHENIDFNKFSERRDSLKERIPFQLGKHIGGSNTFNSYFGILADYIALSFTLKKIDVHKLKATLQLILQAYKATLDTGISKENTVPFSLGEHKGNLETNHDHNLIKAWIGLWEWATICRSTQAKEYLANYPLEAFGRPKDKWEKFYLLYIRFGKKLLQKADSEIIKTTFDAADEQVSNNDMYHSMVNFLYSFSIWEPIVNNDITMFDEYLSGNLKAYKAYWSSNNSDLGYPRHQNIHGFVNFRMTALLAYAYENDFEIKTASDYTPLPLINGDYQVDLDTKLEFYWPLKVFSIEDLLKG